MLSEARHNYPEGYKEGPYCPHTKLVQICASLAGVELTPETFCTEELSNGRFSGGAFNWLEHGDFFPQVSCVEVERKLIQQVRVVLEEVEAPSDEDTTRKIAEAKDMQAKSKVLESYKEAKDAYEERKAIVDRWRKVIFETSVSTTSDEKNVHFRRFESADDLSEDEIRYKVAEFISALDKITGHGLDLNIIRGDGGAENCPKSPEYSHVGPLID